MNNFGTLGKAVQYCKDKGFEDVVNFNNGFELAEMLVKFEKEIRQDQKEKCAKYVHKTISLSIDNDDSILLKNVDKAIMEAD